MDDLLAQNFGIRAQGKSAPMSASKNRSVPSSSSYDDLFSNPSSTAGGGGGAAAASSSPPPPPLHHHDRDPILDTFNQGPVFDSPVYDEDDIFNGIPGIKSSSTTFKYDDVFASAPPSHRSAPPRAAAEYDDLLGNLGKGTLTSDDAPAYDDLLGGFSMPPTNHRPSAQHPKDPPPPPSPHIKGFDDLLPGFGSTTPSTQPKREASRETEQPKAAKGSIQDDPFFVVGNAARSSGSFSDPLEHLTTKREAAVKADAASPTTDTFFSENPNSFDSMPSFTATSESNPNANNHSPLEDFENMPPGGGGPSETHHRSVGSDGSDMFAKTDNNNKYTSAAEEQSPELSEHSDTGDDVWLTVSEIPLFTKPTSAPPPFRLPPPLSIKHNYSFQRDSSPVDDLDERFGFDDGEMERSSAAMKDAMSKAEMKFKHAKEVREKMAKSKEAEQEEEEREKAEVEKEEREKERRRVERERMEERKRVEKERERGRHAVERATREARERAANDAMARAQRAAVLKGQQEARERAAQEGREREVAREREAKEREAKEREVAKERAEREREAKERERRMQRAAVEKAAAEARERLAQAAREKHQQTQSRKQAAAETKVPPPPSSHDDFDSIFGMGASASRSASAPKKNPPPPPPPQESFFDSQPQNRTPSAPAANIRKTPPTANMMDDLTAIFGAPSSSGEFQEIDGETEDRRKARFEREMRTRDRAAKALAEKNARDMHAQHEQAERHRISETLDFEIKRWAAGKEGNLRSLLSSMHYILWPESGWQPVSMADLITGASVKKVYRKATLCIHPDKVQQKGATLQQKYIAEKVFDILKEAWNKFNSEELF